eukprot:CAMPEP_0113400690 /NCGR_PEP_ID=MMETSP0013_2-20120614/16270_1 /TAXON_ID=2843 ORGANISM="Skeletonema costatum, Strain 1716" /NCGR_SAMPLE_ID=MMETSP0013_2 /ASSEMBLY_ACC=CAM_ASM_000158 /LENGTH=237 /DNA_ID=CAMNT_0000285801 /DNA_START=142 /DNA_END=855 /DNA_ORIENTATION=+ /assembly_acc=CAM_ASM_000158
MTMRRYSTDSSSFSGIDWSGMFGESSRRQQQQQQSHNLNADSIDIPSMDGEGGADVASSDGEDKKGLEEHFKQQKRLSVTFDLNEDSCQEDMMEHSRRIGAAKSATSSSSWCLALFTLLAIVVGTVACFIAFPPNTATLNWKKVMSGMSGNNNNVVQQQLLQQQQGRGQEMLELAEQITAACGESSRSSTGTSSCQELCHNHMCCVEQDDEYSCKNDVAEDCGVYAGCVALIDDNLW